MKLPVAGILPQLIDLLDRQGVAVVVAPPGAGKTTAVAPALLDCAWAKGQRILLLSPRRLAARAAAERMAALRGESVGQTIGYRTRMDSRVGPNTRIEVLTEGIFTRMIQDDPELTGVAAVLFDEVHERNLEGDLGLALALDVRGSLRPDLRIVAMSATLDGARYGALLGAEVVESQGRMFEVAQRYLGRDPRERIEDAVARAVHQALTEESGSILVFLPGAAEIERTADRLVVPADTQLHLLYGALEASAQRAAIAPAPPGQRKVVLATSIAETSLTIDGVRVVIDSGLARRARFDRATGLTQLVTERAAQSAVTQRAGRAGRTAPGVVWRLWEKAATAGLPRFDPPEMLESDLTGLTLDLACWGVADPASLQWLDAPPPGNIAQSRARLREIAAIDADARPTPHGRRLARLPLPPRLAHMLVMAAPYGLALCAAQAALLLTERGLGGRDADLDIRRQHWQRDRSPRAQAANNMARRWAALVEAVAVGPSEAARQDALGLVLALGHPDRIALARQGDQPVFLMVNGRAVVLDRDCGLARQQWLVVGDASGSADGARIVSAAAIARSTIDRFFADKIETRTRLEFDDALGAVVAEHVDTLGSIQLARRPAQSSDPEALADILLATVQRRGLIILPWGEPGMALRHRLAFTAEQGADFPDFSDAGLLTSADQWLRPQLVGKRRFDHLLPEILVQALIGLLDWPQRQWLDRIAPARLLTPAGSSHAIDYAAAGGPAVDVRVQALFGLTTHPCVGDGRVALVLRLLSPAQRPIQNTRDLPGFWRGSWAAVKSEMKGRYPRHPWPDDPAAAPPTLRTKRATASEG